MPQRSEDVIDSAGKFAGAGAPGMLAGTRVVEVGDEMGEYCGLLLAGLGADVVKVEPPGGSATRRIGPFHRDRPDPEGSLYFWHYNRAKRSVALDLAAPDGRPALTRLLAGADVLLDSTCGGLNAALGLDRAALAREFPALVVARVTPFGDTGPWQDYKGSDLVHLALGGVMMNCGYDPDPADRYDLPPIAPQLWHAYHIAGEQHAIAILAALVHRHRTGAGQDVACAIHAAVAVATEIDLMSWVMRRAPLYRQTCRHATEARSRTPNISHTKDGRWYITWLIGARDEVNLVPFLERYGMAADLQKPAGDSDFKARDVPGSTPTDERKAHIFEVVQRFVRAYRYDDMPWHEAQEAGLLWAPLRKPHENARDEHWRLRRSFAEVEHPELGRSFTYATSKWLSTETSWQVGRRAPVVGEHTKEVLAEPAPLRAAAPPSPPAAPAPRLSARGRPFPLQGVRILDFSWFLASAGGTRCAAALGAECLKVEWKGNPDTRLGAMAPVGGRAARAAATAPLRGETDPEMGGQFNNKNTGKRGLSLNVRDPRGLAIARELVKICDVVAEGFSPGVLDRLGLGYDALKSIRPDIIYVQQSGMGSHGRYGRMRTVGPIAQAFSGASEMSGLPEPSMPAGWGYSYLDWMGAFAFAQAILGALYYRSRTGKGQRIDASQCEVGLFLNGPAVLDWSANGRPWQRYGNRSPYKPAAPHGAYRCAGDDRWLAIACFTESEWASLAGVAGHPEWGADPRFATLDARLANQDALDALVTAWTSAQGAYQCMHRLQAAGVPAGVCQTAGDRCDLDPQLAALEWLTEVRGTRIGTWPFAEFPVKLSATPAHIGGPINRAAPMYGEDNEYVLGELLGRSSAEIARLAADGVI
jgi:crotonobetainyl-CoA:carnitine CoA-transferase CaiB-like acyl-CoA transferase